MSYSGVAIFERRELLNCSVYQFGLECIKNCALQGVGFARRYKNVGENRGEME